MSQTKAQLISDLVQSLAFTATSSAPDNGLYLSAANTLSFNTNSAASPALTIDSSGNLGVGTTSPIRQLDINHSSHATLALTTGTSGQSSIFFADTDNNVGMIGYFHSTNDMFFRVNDQERARIDSAGRLLVGTPDSVAGDTFLQLVGVNNDESSITCWRSSDDAGSGGFNFIKTRNTVDSPSAANNDDSLGIIRWHAHDGSTWDGRAAQIEGKVDGSVDTGQTPGRLVFSTAAATASTPTARMTIDSSGNVGIGKTSPTTTLHLRAGNPTLTFEDGTTSDTTSISGDAGELTFAIGASPAMTIDSSGNVGIGTITPTQLLDLESATGARIAFTDTGTRRWSIGTPAGGSTSFSIYDESGSSEALRILTSGNVGIGTPTPGAILHLNGTNPFILIEADSTTGNSGFNFSDGTNRGQILYDHDGDYMRFSTAGSSNERMRIDSVGRLLMGTPDHIGASADSREKIQLVENSGARILLGRDDDGVTSGGTMGGVQFYGNGGGTYSAIAQMVCSASQTHSATAKGNEISFWTTPNSSTTITKYLVLTGGGTLRPDTDDQQQLGATGARWSQLYAGTSTINTSDANLKQDVENLEQAELNVATAIKGLIKKYRFIKAVEEKGDDARIHVGVIAQDVEQAFIAEGLDPRRYALFCEDTLENGTKRLGIRYSELLAFVIAAL